MDQTLADAQGSGKTKSQTAVTISKANEASRSEKSRDGTRSRKDHKRGTATSHGRLSSPQTDNGTIDSANSASSKHKYLLLGIHKNRNTTRLIHTNLTDKSTDEELFRSLKKEYNVMKRWGWLRLRKLSHIEWKQVRITFTQAVWHSSVTDQPSSSFSTAIKSPSTKIPLGTGPATAARAAKRAARARPNTYIRPIPLAWTHRSRTRRSTIFFSSPLTRRKQNVPLPNCTEKRR